MENEEQTIVEQEVEVVGCSLIVLAEHRLLTSWLLTHYFVRRFALVCTVRPREVVEALPFPQLGLEIDVTPVAEKLTDLLLVGPVRTFDFAVQLKQVRYFAHAPLA